MRKIYFQNKYKINSTRLQIWDYSSTGYYFITICVKKRECILGKIEQRTFKNSWIGEVVQKCWNKIPNHFEDVSLDAFCVMPNHIHGIIIITCGRDAINRVSTNNIVKNNPMGTGSIGEIVRWFKGRTTYEIRHFHKYNFSWQARFYDHIIRSEKSLFAIREYIEFNYLKWDVDTENMNNNITKKM